MIARSPYVNYRRSEYQGVKLKSLWAPKSRKFEAIIHSTLAAFSTLFDGSNVVHVHAVGPGLVVPLLRLLGKRVVLPIMARITIDRNGAGWPKRCCALAKMGGEIRQ